MSDPLLPDYNDLPPGSPWRREANRAMRQLKANAVRIGNNDPRGGGRQDPPTKGHRKRRARRPLVRLDAPTPQKSL